MTSGILNAAGVDLDDLYDLADQGSTGKTFGIIASDGRDIGARYAPASEGSAGDAVGIIGANGETVGPQFRKKGSSILVWRATMVCGYLKKDPDYWYGRTGWGRYAGRDDLAFGELTVTYNYLGLPLPTHICEQQPEYNEFWVYASTPWNGLYIYVDGKKYGKISPSNSRLYTSNKPGLRVGKTVTVEARRS